MSPAAVDKLYEMMVGLKEDIATVKETLNNRTDQERRLRRLELGGAIITLLVMLMAAKSLGVDITSIL